MCLNSKSPIIDTAGDLAVTGSLWYSLQPKRIGGRFGLRGPDVMADAANECGQLVARSRARVHGLNGTSGLRIFIHLAANVQEKPPEKRVKDFLGAHSYVPC